LSGKRGGAKEATMEIDIDNELTDTRNQNIAERASYDTPVYPTVPIPIPELDLYKLMGKGNSWYTRFAAWILTLVLK
jgi:hypothetical protein